MGGPFVMASHLTSDAPSRSAEPAERGAPSLGQLLRSARESRGLTIDQISEVTKIGKRLLEAIEADAFERLPGGIFDRAFIRAFAREVGVDEEEGVSLYIKAVGGRAERGHRQAPSADVLTIAGGIALALLVAVGLWYFS